ncbi:response regulator transcription factor [Ralstonia solanacearum]|uniref:DNA-binding response regulator n=1 Tax=Ralstonia solanacearum K60 TaxID=1091042 RepID=A0AAP7ZN94_RALSL|nr:response regulator transcription factor [Ralstonia solanacearum]MBT1536667.1 response regulator transcription factor [Ralstonia solanacearum]OYQ13608.1 DNA-binding response regulator [Ralstonia solanacearum K60]QOK80969.1 response regulator transcription factor [Ralstonia solanacearum]RIJ86671.1 DNA-binding response regulator [Ralstonia solanacearum]CCF97845.1 putative two component response regulator transcription regulator protein [Ralstonia solanacearum K60]
MCLSSTAAELPSIHVAIVEDDPGFLDALTQALACSPDMRLTGVAGSRAEGLRLLDGTPADVLLVDLGLPDGSGIDVIEAAARKWSACSIMVSTHFGDETHVMRSIEAGAAGYLLKDSSAARILDEIRSLAGGGSPISPIIARQILARFRQGGARGAADEAPPASASPPLLSAREKEVLDLITKGFTTQEIAKLMALSHFTVRTFVRRIYSKLKVTSKAEAIYEARTLGLLAD